MYHVVFVEMSSVSINRRWPSKRCRSWTSGLARNSNSSKWMPPIWAQSSPMAAFRWPSIKEPWMPYSWTIRKLSRPWWPNISKRLNECYGQNAIYWKIEETLSFHVVIFILIGYWSSQFRIGGRYLCITLLQKHILEFIADYFPKNSFLMRIVYCQDAQHALQEKLFELTRNHDTLVMPVFMLVATKFKSLASPVNQVDL